MAPAGRALLTVGASLRLTRLVLTDELGVRAVEHVRAFAGPRLGPERAWLLDGLECEACVSWHAAWLVMLTEQLTRDRPILGRAWEVIAGSLAASELVLHLGSRLGDYDRLDT